MVRRNLSPEDMNELLADVVRTDNHPKVVFKYGFRIEEIDGEKVLVAMTPDEFTAMIKRRPENADIGDQLLDGCGIYATTCLATNCDPRQGKHCDGPHYDEGGFYCSCVW